MTSVVKLMCLCLCIGNFNLRHALGETLREAVRSRDTDRVVTAIESAKESDFQRDVSELVPLLIAIVDHNKYGQPEIALGALAKLGDRAAPAIPILCRKLDDNRHWIRGESIETLVSLGEPAVGPVRELLRHQSGLTRAGATAVLGRLKRLDLREAQTLAGDSEPRVRFAAARAMEQMGFAAVPHIVPLLTDAEPAVGVSAVRALQTNRADAATAIAALTKVVSRPGVGAAAVGALGSYGIEARHAVPAIIKAYPVGDVDGEPFLRGDASEAALRHIGPPDPADLAELAECLLLPDCEARILAVEYIGMLGLEAAMLAPALKSTANAALDEFVELQKIRDSMAGGRLQVDDGSGRVALLAELSAVALWHSTHEATGFLQLVQAIVERTDEPLVIYQDSPWRELDANALPAVEKMLTSHNLHLQQTALWGIAQMGPRALSLKDRLLDLLRRPEGLEKARVAAALAGLGPLAADTVESALLNVGLTLTQIAECAIPLDMHSPETIALLERGLLTGNRAEADQCLRALIHVTRDPQRTVKLVIKAFEDLQLSFSGSLEQLGKFKGYHELLVPFYIGQISDRDIENTQAALDRLAEMGENARPAVSLIETHLKNKEVDIRLRAAAAVYRITQNRDPLERELKRVFEPPNSVENVDLEYGFQTISNLKEYGSPFIPYVAKLARQPQLGYFDRAIETLADIGTPEAIAVLHELAQSTDWEVRSAVIGLLKQKR